MAETESSTLVAPAVDISGGVTLDALETLEETACEAALVVTEGDDSVFYSEDEEVPQQIFNSVCAQQSVELFGPVDHEPAPQIQHSGAEETEQTLSHSFGLMEAGSEHHSDSMLEDVERLMENKRNNVSSSATVQDETEISSQTSVAHNEEFSKPSTMQHIMSTTAEAAPLPLPDKVVMDKSLTNTEREKDPESQSETKEKVGADGSIAITEHHDEETEEPDEENESCDNMTQGKYGTVSYRRIRRGLARQRIEEFEAMMQL